MASNVAVAVNGRVAFRGKHLGIVSEAGVTINGAREYLPRRRFDKMRPYDVYLAGLKTTISFSLRQWNFTNLVASLGAMLDDGIGDAYEDLTVLQSTTAAYGDLVIAWEDEGQTYQITASRVLFGSESTTLSIGKGNVELPCACEVLKADSGPDWYLSLPDLPVSP